VIWELSVVASGSGAARRWRPALMQREPRGALSPTSPFTGWRRSVRDLRISGDGGRLRAAQADLQGSAGGHVQLL
jgi:hypothetical protein